VEHDVLSGSSASFVFRASIIAFTPNNRNLPETAPSVKQETAIALAAQPNRRVGRHLTQRMSRK
jgi:hypothetical protein